MIEDELIRIWQSSPNQERVKFQKSRLLIEVQSSLDRLHREIRNRDRMDKLGLLIAIPAFGIATLLIPFTLSKIACGCIVLWSVYLVFRQRRARRDKPDAFTGTYLEYLLKTRKFLLFQKQHLDTVLYWAIIPFIVFTSMFFTGLMERPDVTLTKTLMRCGGAVLLSIVVYMLNKWTVKNQIVPRLDKVNELIRAMATL